MRNSILDDKLLFIYIIRLVVVRWLRILLFIILFSPEIETALFLQISFFVLLFWTLLLQFFLIFLNLSLVILQFHLESIHLLLFLQKLIFKLLTLKIWNTKRITISQENRTFFMYLFTNSLGMRGSYSAPWKKLMSLRRRLIRFFLLLGCSVENSFLRDWNSS